MPNDTERADLVARLEDLAPGLDTAELGVLVQVAEGLASRRDPAELDGSDWAAAARRHLRDGLALVAAECERYERLRRQGAA